MGNSSSFGWGKPNGNAISICTEVGNANHYTEYAYEKGASMVGLTASVYLHCEDGSFLLRLPRRK